MLNCRVVEGLHLGSKIRDFGLLVMNMRSVGLVDVVVLPLATSVSEASRSITLYYPSLVCEMSVIDFSSSMVVRWFLLPHICARAVRILCTPLGIFGSLFESKPSPPFVSDLLCSVLGDDLLPPSPRKRRRRELLSGKKRAVRLRN